MPSRSSSPSALLAIAEALERDFLATADSVGWLLLALVVMGGLHAWTFYSQGGEIRKVVTSKTNTSDIRSATIVDFAIGLVLLVLKEWSRIPMRTAWVFPGLLAGREIAMASVRAGQPALR